MAEDNLVLEHLRAIRADLSDVRDRMDRMEMRMATMEQYMGQMIAMAGADRDSVRTLARRVDRIERRLELSD